jgi:hypothetical protein
MNLWTLVLHCVPQQTLHASTQTIVQEEIQVDTPRDKKIHFLDPNELKTTDFFSGAWLQPMEMFLKLDTNEIGYLEAGSFAVFRPNRSKLRMTLDWLDFSVEHMYVLYHFFGLAWLLSGLTIVLILL